MSKKLSFYLWFLDFHLIQFPENKPKFSFQMWKMVDLNGKCFFMSKLYGWDIIFYFSWQPTLYATSTSSISAVFLSMTRCFSIFYFVAVVHLFEYNYFLFYLPSENQLCFYQCYWTCFIFPHVLLDILYTVVSLVAILENTNVMVIFAGLVIVWYTPHP